MRLAGAYRRLSRPCSAGEPSYPPDSIRDFQVCPMHDLKNMNVKPNCQFGLKPEGIFLPIGPFDECDEMDSPGLSGFLRIVRTRSPHLAKEVLYQVELRAHECEFSKLK